VREAGYTACIPIAASQPADGFELSPSVSLMTTPGHTAQDITTLAQTGRR
jgi:hypothetical protein